ncbi:MAG TPA: alkaline phosphatase family protein [Candidatus Dormibacteraeota bacterium]|nr:alkaline phosphatase family protein [Candidatus Dormibacteraeota bacterium]
MKRVSVFVYSCALAGAIAGAAGCSSSTTTPVVRPTPAAAIQHVIIMMQENRSFNNIFAGFPGADTAMSGPCKPEGQAAKWCKGDHIVKLHSVNLKTGTPNFGNDIDHSHRGFGVECDPDASNVCAMDGFNLIRFGESGQGQVAKLYPYAYVDRKETAPYWKLAQQYTLADKMFLTDTASSFIAHQLILSGTVRLNDRESLTDQPPVTPWGCDAPPGTRTPVLLTNGHENFNGPFPCFTEYRTIADLLDAKNVSYLFYVMQGLDQSKPYFDFSGAAWNGFDAIKKFRYSPDWKNHISIPNTNIFADLKGGTLPAVSWVIPTLFDSDHPASGCNGGPRWVTSVVNAVGTSQYWKHTAIVLLWDDWGGWYDNAPPPQVNYTSSGMRIPLIVISPYAIPHNVSHTEYNYGSILRFIEETFNLGSLDTTDATANSLSDSLNLTQTPNTFTAALLPPKAHCGNGSASGDLMRQIIEHDGGVPE